MRIRSNPFVSCRKADDLPLVDLPFLFLPEDRFHAKLALFLNQAANVMAENLAKNFIDHRELALRPNRIPELALDSRERGFDV